MCSLWVTALAPVSLAGAEPLQHRSIRLHADQYKTPQLADQWTEKIVAASKTEQKEED